MMSLFQIVIVLVYLGVGHSYTKYGRTCQDIGCPSNQRCVIQTDPCSYYSRQGECGSYPTCERISGAVRTCASYTCPPSKVCKMDGDTPKCFDDASSAGHVGYDTSSANDASNRNSNSGGQLYPNIPKSQTTPRPNINRPVQTGGYQGGQVGSGYPGGQVGSGYPGGQVGSGYPGGQVGSGYPGGQVGSGYPGGQVGSGYPGGQVGSGYPGGQVGSGYPGYTQQRNGYQPNYAQPGYQQGNYPQGYQQPGYQQQGYQQQGNYPRQTYYPQQAGYPQQGGYQGYPQGNQRQNTYQQYGGYPQNQGQKPNSGTSVVDKISDGIKSIGGIFKKIGIN